MRDRPLFKIVATPLSQSPRHRALALCAAVSVALLVPSAGAQESEGKRLFEKTCAPCHGETRIVGALRKIPKDERVPYLRSFVPTHNYMDAGERELIIQHLGGQAS